MGATRARGRPHRTPRGWQSLAPERHGTSGPCCGETPASLGFRLGCDQACRYPSRVLAPEQRDRGVARSIVVVAWVRRDQAQAPVRQEAWWWPSGCGRSPVE